MTVDVEQERLLGRDGPHYLSVTKPNVLQAPANEAIFLAGHDGAFEGMPLDNVPHEKRQLGLTSATFLIVNRILGTGIYATPTAILQSCGSIGLSLLMWVIGAMIAAAGTAVYIELGTGLPRNGGEKNYLEFIYRRPRFLISYLYAMLIVFIGWSAASTVLFGEYVLHSLGLPLTRWNSRLVGAVALTVTFLLHGTQLNWGLRVQNTLGVFTILVLMLIIAAGLAVLIVPGLLGVAKTDNLQWTNLWAGTRLEPNAFVTALYNVIWCFNGYTNANYALSEVRNPVRTIKIAAPLALFAVTAMYLFANLSYFAVVEKAEILGGGRVIAALFFRNILGPGAERTVSMTIALSLLGNMMALQFAQGRVIQELGREGILPYSAWFASNRPFNAPLIALSLQWAVSLVTAMLPPPGDAFNFTLQLNSYCTVMVYIAVSGGLLFLHSRWARAYGYNWKPPFNAWTSIIAFFFLSNVFLAVTPLIPPARGYAIYEHIPYFLHCVVSLGLAFIGAIIYYFRCVYLPRQRGYELIRDSVIEEGIPRKIYRKVRVE